MKTFIIFLTALFYTIAGFSQKATAAKDTSLNKYFVFSCPMHPQYISPDSVKCPVCHMSMIREGKTVIKPGAKLYTCSMHPDVLSTKPGRCPECNMDLVEFNPNKKISGK